MEQIEPHKHWEQEFITQFQHFTIQPNIVFNNKTKYEERVESPPLKQ